MRLALPLAVTLVPALIGPTAAQEDPLPSPPVEPPAVEEPEPPEPTPMPVIVGRIFMRDTISKIGVAGAEWRNDPALASARVAAEYEPSDAVKFVLEIELAGAEAELKDGYVRLQPASWFEAQVGHFKRPISAVDLESIWTLPVLERGLLSELTVGDTTLPLGSREEGIQLSFDTPDAPMDPTLRVALFRNRFDDTVDLGLELSEMADDLYARFELEPVDSLVVSVSGALVPYLETAGDPMSMSHAAVGSLDVVLRTRPLDLWAEVFYGENTLPTSRDGTTLVARGEFAAARAVVAPRIRKPLPWLHSLQPFGAFSWLEPSSDVDDDGANQLMIGLNSYWSRDGRIQLVLEQTWAQAGAPTADRTAFGVQLATVF